jgi:hypothetical protein
MIGRHVTLIAPEEINLVPWEIAEFFAGKFGIERLWSRSARQRYRETFVSLNRIPSAGGELSRSPVK